MNLDQARQTFIDESRELLQTMEELLLAAEAAPCDAEAVNALFRCAHTVKGSAGLFGLESIVRFTHGVESVLERVRGDELALDAPLIALLLECRDHIADLLAAVAAESGEPGAALVVTGERLVAALRAYLPANAAPAVVPVEPIEIAVGAVATMGGGQVAADTWHVSLRFGRDLFRNGMDPQSFVSYLGELGRLVHVTTITEALPPVEEMDPESCYLGFEIDLDAQCDKAAIDAAFDFVREDCDVRILPPHSKIEEYVRLIDALPEDPMRLGEILVAGGALTAAELGRALELQRGAASGAAAQAQKLGEILVADGLAPEPTVRAALEKQKRSEDRRLQETRLVKVPAERLDGLINLVGELVIAGATTSALANREKHAGLIEATSVLARLVEEIRDAALRLRMVQIGEVFARFPRVVRDLTKDLGKDVDLRVTGAETELDKSMVEHIGDPLMHLVRNALDHGIESTERRLARGKPARGVVSLNAYHDSGSVVVEVGDDGGGLDAERIRAKAIDKGLLAADAAIGEQDLFRLILEPGFSTAHAVTDLSGRGVGMDVVKRNVEALRGTIEIQSRAGEGSTFKLRLPLTLAIIDGFLVQVGRGYYVIPLDMVVECVEFGERAQVEVGERDFINLRGTALPFVRLDEVFEVGRSCCARQSIVVIQFAGRRAGLVVDRLMGELQTVIKPLSRLFRRIRGVSGSTILGTGDVALILDVPGLVQLATGRDGGAHPAGPGSRSVLDGTASVG